jgi:monoamine oxidase
VKQISHVGDIVTVSIMGGASVVAAAAVVTVPIPVLQRGIIKFTPPLSDLKQKALSSLECEPALKIHAKFTSRTWPHNLHGMVCSDDFAPEIWFDHHQAADCSLYYCTAFFTSDQARAITALDTVDAFHLLIDQLNRMFKTSCEKFFCGGFICDWGAVPYIWGGYTVPSKKGASSAVHGTFS